MHIYVDESGIPKDGLIVVSAVAGKAKDVSGLLKRIRRDCGIRKPELKGSDLSDRQRGKAIERYIASNCRSAIVLCAADDPGSGGWALGTLPQDRLWTELVVEAVERVMALSSPCFGVTIDGGRFSHRLLQMRRCEIEKRLGGPLVVCGASHAHGGIQVADLLANTVFRGYREGGCDQELVNRLQANGSLAVYPARLTEVTPQWMTRPLPEQV